MKMTKKHKEFLNKLRRSGKVNMFGAAPYLAEAFGLEVHEARVIVSEWMDKFDPEKDS